MQVYRNFQFFFFKLQCYMAFNVIPFENLKFKNTLFVILGVNQMVITCVYG